MSQFQHLFEPIQVGPMRVANRICETTNTINSSQLPGAIDDHFIAHHLATRRRLVAKRAVDGDGGGESWRAQRLAHASGDYGFSVRPRWPLQ